MTFPRRSDHTFKVTLPVDESGMLGRKCPSALCAQYFKLKPRTGLPTSRCHCPYCGEAGESADFATAAQIEYAQSVAVTSFLEPELRKFRASLRELESSSAGGWIQIKVTTSPISFRLARYLERDLETLVTCDACGLEFAVYGVFASCPDCQRLNALSTFLASIATAEKRLALAERDDLDADLAGGLVEDALRSSVAALDAFGKAWRKAQPKSVSANAKENLFQDLDALSLELHVSGGPSIRAVLGEAAWDQLHWHVQARHLYEHNAGVVDARFIRKRPESAQLLGRKLPLSPSTVRNGLDQLRRLAAEMDQLQRSPAPEDPKGSLYETGETE